MESPSTHSWLTALQSHSTLVLITCVALGARLSFFMPVHAQGYTSDEREYVSMARQLVDSKDFIDSNGERSTRAPLFPLFLAGLFKATGGSVIIAQLVGCILGTIVVVLGYLLSMQVWNDRQAALVAAALIAVYPGLVIYSGLLQTETLYIAFFLLALWFAYRTMDNTRSLTLAGLGLVSGLAALTRVVYLGFFPLLLALLLWKRRTNGAPGGGKVVLALALFCVVTAPWTIRNYEIHHALVPISSGGGNSLLTGSNPYATGTWRVEEGFEQWYSEQAKGFGVADVTALSETERSELSGRIAREYIRTHPLDVLRLVMKKAHILLVYPITHSDSLVPLQALAVGFDFLLVLGAAVGIVASFRGRGRPGIIYASIVFFVLVQLVFHSESRFRLPLLPLVCMLFGVGIATVVDKDRLKELFSVKENTYGVLAAVTLVMVVYVLTGVLFLKGSL
jgi:4-amino-4-deoxy-L-arabinose transferase-like glycosyltransferase